MATIASLSAAYARRLKLSGLPIGSTRGDTAAPAGCGADATRTLAARGLRSPLLMAGIQYSRTVATRNGGAFAKRTPAERRAGRFCRARYSAGRVRSRVNASWINGQNRAM